MISDYSFDTIVTEPVTVTVPSGGITGISSSSIVNPVTTVSTASTSSKPVVTIPVINVNPTKPCTNVCPTCNNNFQSKLVRATGKLLIFEEKKKFNCKNKN